MDSIEIHAMVSRLLELASEPGAENQLDAFGFRDDAAQYLADYDSELKRFPELVGQPHFDLVMADYDLSRDTVFVAYAFEPEEMVLFAGRGSAAAVKDVCEHEAPDDYDGFCKLLRDRATFSSPPVRLPRPAAIAWLVEIGSDK
jgi:hypothetical protein